MTFVSFALKQAVVLASLGDTKMYGTSSNDNDGGAILADPTAMRVRFQYIGTIGRQSAETTMPFLSQQFNEQLNQTSTPDLLTLTTLMNVCSCLLVRHNSIKVVHQLVPYGVRSSPHSLQLIELLLKIVSNLTDVWRTTPLTQTIDWKLKSLTQETCSCMVSFVKVWLDPMSPPSDPLLPQVKVALQSYKLQIVNVLVTFLR